MRPVASGMNASRVQTSLGSAARRTCSCLLVLRNLRLLLHQNLRLLLQAHSGKGLPHIGCGALHAAQEKDLRLLRVGLVLHTRGAGAEAMPPVALCANQRVATKRRAKRYIYVGLRRQAWAVRISSRCFRTESTVGCCRLHSANRRCDCVVSGRFLQTCQLLATSKKFLPFVSRRAMAKRAPREYTFPRPQKTAGETTCEY